MYWKDGAWHNSIYRFDGQNYQQVGDSKFSHQLTYGIANFRGNALTTGCATMNALVAQDCDVKTEILDMTTMTWSDADDYPFTSEWVK